MWVDSHCHLDFPQFDGKLNEVLARARKEGVGLAVTIGTELGSAGRLHEILDSDQGIYGAIGVHPHKAGQGGEVTLDALVSVCASHPKLIAVGESGLDFHYDHAPRDVQERSFRTHARVARRLDLPLVVHSRSADEETVRILAEESEPAGPDEKKLRGVIHCFTGGEEFARQAVALGFYLSFSGVITFRNADLLRKIVAETEQSRILVETDAPYLAPEPHRGQVNEPAYVVRTAERIAALLGQSAREFADRTTTNFQTLFNRAPMDAYGTLGAKGA